VRSANHLDIGIDKEQCDNLAMARLYRIGELEWADAMLKNVGEGEQAAFAGLNSADLLYRWALVLAPEHLREEFVVVLWVTNVNGFFLINELSEGER